MAGFPHIEDERILATWSGGEDAALWKIDERRLGVLTVDFITPVVDDPYTWGQVAAANSISDVFAMGGRPVVALNVVGFPASKLELDILKKILEGGYSKVREAGAFLVGGHSVQDDEPKYGLVVYGEVETDKIWRTSGAQASDVLILTKPLGTGVAVTGLKAGMIEDPQTVTQATFWMTKLNDLPLHLPERLHRSVHAATDVTGFGLIGHTLDMLEGADLDLHLSLKDVPFLAGVSELADMGLIPEGTYRNRVAYEDKVDIEVNAPDARVDLLFDAQTSGGLLLAVPSDYADSMLTFCREAGFSYAAVIGTFAPGKAKIRLH